MKIVVGLRNVLINHTLRTERMPNTVKLNAVGAGPMPAMKQLRNLLTKCRGHGPLLRCQWHWYIPHPALGMNSYEKIILNHNDPRHLRSIFYRVATPLP